MTTGQKYPKRGFASMPKDQRCAIASLGGKAAHSNGCGAHEWTVETAALAGRKGGLASAAAKRAKRLAAA